MSDQARIFDRTAVRRHRDRAAPLWHQHDFLAREVGSRLQDRLREIKRGFPMVLDLGCHGGELAASLRGEKGIETLVQCDLSPEMARRAAANGCATLVADEEVLPFRAASFDLALSCLSLHWVNDLPGALLQVRQALKPDGLFLAAIFGGDCLHELRVALMEAEVAVTGGLSPRVSPFAQTPDAGGLLQRAGFALPVVDVDEIVVTYADPIAAMRDLRGMGEANAVETRRREPMARAILAKAVEIHGQRFAAADGRVPVTFEVLYLTGWAPHADQPRPLAPGSASARLADALGGKEHSAGDRARPRR